MQKYTNSQNAALVVLRIFAAAIFIYAGLAKWPFWGMEASEVMPAYMIYLTNFLSIVEPLGAIALIGGFLTRWAAAGLALIMAGSVFFVYFTMKASLFTGMEGTGMDYNLLLLGTCVALAAFGAGKWSVDALQKRA